MTLTLPRTLLSRARISTSRLAFGTSRLHHVDRRSGLGLPMRPWTGICHFDTAPSYGDGLAERRWATSLRGWDRLIIATEGDPAQPADRRLPGSGLPVRGVRALARRAGWLANSRPPSRLASYVQRGKLPPIADGLHRHIAVPEPDPRRTPGRRADVRGAWPGIRGLVRWVGLTETARAPPRRPWRSHLAR